MMDITEIYNILCSALSEMEDAILEWAETLKEDAEKQIREREKLYRLIPPKHIRFHVLSPPVHPSMITHRPRDRLPFSKPRNR